jgi:hypothetical protein
MRRADARQASRRGGRVVECAALEMRFAGNGNVGSNPTLSAIMLSQAISCSPTKALKYVLFCGCLWINRLRSSNNI